MVRLMVFPVNEEYEFKFKVVSDGKEVHLQDKNEFNFLSIKLTNDDVFILDEKLAINLLKDFKDSFEGFLQEYQERWIIVEQERKCMSRMGKLLSAYNAEREELEKQLKNANTEDERFVIEFKINKIDETIDDIRSKIEGGNVDY